MSRFVKAAHARTRVITDIPEDTKTRCVQSEKNSSDINNIVARAYKTGQLPILTGRQPMAELPNHETYQDMLNQVVFAQQSFERLPSAVRSAFDNDPVRMLQQLADDKRHPDVTKLFQAHGILETPPPAPQEAQKPDQPLPGSQTAE